MGLRDLVDRTLVDVRLTAGLSERRERIVVAEFTAEVQVAATIEAAGRDLEFLVAPIEKDLARPRPAAARRRRPAADRAHT